MRFHRTNKRALPSTPRLRELLSYDPNTGTLRRRTGRNAGKIVGSRDQFGYMRVMIDGIAYQCHRVIWKMCAWADPEHEIDHRNGNKSDNRWANLRPATLLQNGKNRGISKNNRSGFKGVHWHSGRQKWSASIRVDGTRIHLGNHTTPQGAHAAYAAAAAQHYGAFVRQ